MRAILKASKRDRIACIVQLGYTKIEPISPSKKQISEIVSYIHF
jgi:hypothetical protein